MISVFDLIKVGIGPSSSHTMGPMKAAHLFLDHLDAGDLLASTARVAVDLYGSLALTGVAHGIDRALLLGLEGERPESVDLDTIDPRLTAIRVEKKLSLGGRRAIAFDEADDVRFHRSEVLPFHTNGMRFTAFDEAGKALLTREYYSIGGGFVVEPGQTASASAQATVPYEFRSGAELLRMAREAGLSIADLVLANERALRPGRDIKAGLIDIWRVMHACTARGLATTGQLPGGLRVQRRAAGLAAKLRASGTDDPLRVLDWVSVWALAVNEENAAGGRVVTAPTNGAAGIVPAVLHYYTELTDGVSDEGISQFLLAAAAIGILCKTNASISGAELGCQGEVGVACAMAAAGLVAALGGKNEQMEHAAEIGIEHHLGMTCDPVGGLVQIPCIERNAVGAVQAIHASRIAMEDDAEHRVTLDQVIETMKQTGRDMQSSYKETSLAGLAVNVINC